MPDGFEDHVRAFAASERHDLRDPLLTSLGDDMGGAESASKLGAGLVAAHQDDGLGSQLPRGEDG